jgi:hypothetical protein
MDDLVVVSRWQTCQPRGDFGPVSRLTNGTVRYGTSRQRATGVRLVLVIARCVTCAAHRDVVDQISSTSNDGTAVGRSQTASAADPIRRAQDGDTTDERCQDISHVRLLCPTFRCRARRPPHELAAERNVVCDGRRQEVTDACYEEMRPPALHLQRDARWSVWRLLFATLPGSQVDDRAAVRLQSHRVFGSIVISHQSSVISRQSSVGSHQPALVSRAGAQATASCRLTKCSNGS